MSIMQAMLMSSGSQRHLCVGVSNGADYIRMYDISGGAPFPVVTDHPALSQLCRGLDFSPGGDLLALGSTSNDKLQVWQINQDWDKLTLGSLPANAGQEVAFSPDGAMLASAGSSTPYMAVYDTSDWSKYAAPSTLPVADSGSPYGYTCAFSPDSSMLAVGGKGDTRALTIYNTSDWSVRSDFTMPTGCQAVWSVHWSPDGAYLAFCWNGPSPDYFHNLTIYDTSNWSEVSHGITFPRTNVWDGPARVRFSPDSAIMVCRVSTSTTSKTLAVYNVGTWTTVKDTFTAPDLHPATANVIRFSRDGSICALATNDNWTSDPDYYIGFYDTSDWSLLDYPSQGLDQVGYGLAIL